MSDSDFDQAFGTGIASSTSFAERLGRTDPAKANGVAASVETNGSGAYKPYGFAPAGGVEACEIVSWVPGTLIKEGIVFPLRLLLEVTFTGEEQLRLHLPTCIVVLDGQNLGELREKLARKLVTFACEWSPKVWAERPPKGEPIIEKIAIVRPDGT